MSADTDLRASREAVVREHMLAENEHRWDDVLATLREVNAMSKHFTPEQIETLKRRAAELDADPVQQLEPGAHIGAANSAAVGKNAYRQALTVNIPQAHHHFSPALSVTT